MTKTTATQHACKEKNRKIPLLARYAFLAWLGGSTYVTLEVLYRGHSHWTMLVLGALCFVAIGLLNNALPWELGLVWQMLIGAGIITVLELIVGLVANVWLGWGVWDYSHMPGNFMGQICPQYTVLWVVIALAAILLDDAIRWRFFGEQKPEYKII